MWDREDCENDFEKSIGNINRVVSNSETAEYIVEDIIEMIYEWSTERLVEMVNTCFTEEEKDKLNEMLIRSCDSLGV